MIFAIELDKCKEAIALINKTDDNLHSSSLPTMKGVINFFTGEAGYFDTGARIIAVIKMKSLVTWFDMPQFIYSKMFEIALKRNEYKGHKRVLKNTELIEFILGELWGKETS